MKSCCWGINSFASLWRNSLQRRLISSCVSTYSSLYVKRIRKNRFQLFTTAAKALPLRCRSSDTLSRPGLEARNGAPRSSERRQRSPRHSFASLHLPALTTAAWHDGHMPAWHTSKCWHKHTNSSITNAVNIMKNEWGSDKQIHWAGQWLRLQVSRHVLCPALQHWRCDTCVSYLKIVL